MIQAANIASITVPSPVGELMVTEQEGAIISLAWDCRGPDDNTSLLNAAADWLRDFFGVRGSQRPPNFPIKPSGTLFQNQVWKAISSVPTGKMLSYGAIARKLGSSPRAVGGACGANPIPILIPCHRIISSNGELGGYSGSGGLETKRTLLDIETSTRTGLPKAV